MDDMIIVTDWEPVDEEDFYLTDKWLIDELNKTKEQAEKVREMAKNGEIYEAYAVPAKSYALFSQMDATKIFINSDGDYLFSGESAVINNKHSSRWEDDS